MNSDEAKNRIIDSFERNVKGKYPSKEELKSNHAGKIGHWLEASLGKDNHDSDGAADFWGWECKTSSPKISWGDWGAPYRIFCDERFGFDNKINTYENQWRFVNIFGVYRQEKDRFSWSGKHVPTRNGDQTSLGMQLTLDPNKDISIYYDYYKDCRANKSSLVPNELKQDKLLLLRWHGTNNSFSQYKLKVEQEKLPVLFLKKGQKAAVSLEERIRRKFGIHGFFKGLHKDKIFYGLAFTQSISFDDWIEYFINGDIIYDTGLTDGNKRPYNQWRSSKKFMDGLITEIYK